MPSAKQASSLQTEPPMKKEREILVVAVSRCVCVRACVSLSRNAQDSSGYWAKVSLVFEVISQRPSSLPRRSRSIVTLIVPVLTVLSQSFTVFISRK